MKHSVQKNTKYSYLGSSSTRGKKVSKCVGCNRAYDEMHDDTEINDCLHFFRENTGRTRVVPSSVEKFRKNFNLDHHDLIDHGPLDTLDHTIIILSSSLPTFSALYNPPSQNESIPPLQRR